MHGVMDGMREAIHLAMYAYVGALLLFIFIVGVEWMATRAKAYRMRAGLARRRADLVDERNRRASEGTRSAALAIMAASPETGVLVGIGPATRARLIGVDELMVDDSDEHALFI